VETHPWIVPLSDADGASSAFGGKAANLARLAQAGFRVAPGFCISIGAYEQFLEANRLRAVIQMELGRKPLDQMRWEEIWDAALRIRNRFLNSAIAEDLTQNLSERVMELGAYEPLAVRSSAPGEDSADRSFAGLHESYLNVVGPRAVCDAVRMVWASLWSDAALLYRKELCLDPTKSRMAVLVQVMQNEDCSGVAFGCDPRNGDLDRAIIEAVPGACADLVDGNTDPDRWVFARSSKQLIESRRGDTADRKADRELLAGTDLQALLEVLDRVEELMGWPPDMEWTGRHNRFALLQARPVTQAGSCAADADDRRPWYLTLRPGRQKLKALCDRVAKELIPELQRTGDRLAAEDLNCLDDQALADCIEERKNLIDHWKKVYWDEFIPMAHGVRYLGLYYNDAVRPEDPYEFVELLRGEDMLAAQRNRSMREVAQLLSANAPVRDVVEQAIRTTDSASALDQFLDNAVPAVSGGQACLDAINELRKHYLDIAFDGVRLADRPGALLQTVLELCSKVEADREEDGSDKISADDLEKRLLDKVGPEREEEAREVLRLGRLSWRLRDDDNILVARLESQLLRALDAAMERLKAAGRVDAEADSRAEYLDLVCSALRDLSGGAVALPKVEVSEGRETSADAAEKPRQLIGQPAAAGIARGCVRIVQSAADLESFRAGEVLVCDAIQPMMTHLVPLACAVIERRGGMLIHGAIIARELGIPCVNGISKLTELLDDGVVVTVDGHLGIVSVGEAELDLELRG
jgi:phosphohistidine swiveling domain-containing protein